MTFVTVDLLRQLILELISAPKISTRPNDRVGAGYARLGEPRSSGMHRSAGESFPYTGEEDGNDIEPIDGEDSDEFLDKLATKIGAYTSTATRKRTDQFAYCSGATPLGDGVEPIEDDVINETGEDALPVIITLQPRSTKAVGGSQYGWSHRPPPFARGDMNPNDADNDEEVWTIEDIIDADEDKVLSHRNSATFKRSKMIPGR